MIGESARIRKLAGDHCQEGRQGTDMNLELNDKVVLVTGGGRRVGAEISRTLHAAGARVVVHYRRSVRGAQELTAELNGLRPGSALSVNADLQDCATLPGLVAATVDHFGRLDALVNNASSFFATPVGTITEANWDDLIGSNFKAPLFLSQAALPYLKAAQGAIVNITDIHAERPLKDFPLYCAAKAGLLGLTRALALELAPEVRVNAVAPGPILWPEDGSFGDDARQEIIARTPLARCGEPHDIARTVLFLLAGAPYISGQVLAVDGGRSCYV